MALYLCIRIGAFLSKIMPRSWRYLVGTAVGDLVFWSWPAKRRTIIHNMATVLNTHASDPRVHRVALKSMRNYVKYLVEFLELPTLSPHDPFVASIVIHGEHHLQDALSRGKGVILASAHFGTLELGGLRLTQMTDYHAVYDTFRPAYLDRLIQRKRLDKGIQLVGVKDVRTMLRILRAGSTLALLFDRPMALGAGVPVKFFGRETAVPGGPGVLALRTGAAVLPAFIFRKPDRTFEGVILPPLQWTPSGSRDDDVRTIMQKLMDALQAAVSERPDQWYMFRPMWPLAHGLDGESVRSAAPSAGS